jgi:hypothetical protein
MQPRAWEISPANESQVNPASSHCEPSNSAQNHVRWRSARSADDLSPVGIVDGVPPGPVRLAAGHLARCVLHRLATGDVQPPVAVGQGQLALDHRRRGHDGLSFPSSSKPWSAARNPAASEKHRARLRDEGGSVLVQRGEALDITRVETLRELLDYLARFGRSHRPPGDVNPNWLHRDGGKWPHLSLDQGLAAWPPLGYPQKMQVGSQSISVRRSSTRCEGASRS